MNIDQTITLGPSGPRLNPLGLGTWQWGNRLLWGYGRGYREADLRSAFEASLASGVTLFDTAEVYGQGTSERLLGQFTAAANGLALVATKFMPFPWRLGPRDLRRALEGSLRRLGLTTVDLYQIHWPTPLVPIETWMAALAEVFAAGLVGAVGVSNYSAAQTRRAQAALAAHGVHLATNQVQYSLLQRKIERDDTLAVCRGLGVTVIAYSPLAMGLLGGRYNARRPPPGWRRLLYYRRGPRRVDALVGQLREVGQAHAGKTPSQVALNWLICQGVVPIPGAKNAQQATENGGALGWRLTADELSAIEAEAGRGRQEGT